MADEGVIVMDIVLHLNLLKRVAWFHHLTDVFDLLVSVAASLFVVPFADDCF